jgi:beta-mannosidase
VIGFRRVRIIQDPLLDQDGRSFLFEINNVRIFCGGSNWIPADSFLTVCVPHVIFPAVPLIDRPSVTDEVYRAWLKLMVDGNQNMVRIWGGGIYEADAFYDICDGMPIQPLLYSVSLFTRRARTPCMARLYVWLWSGLLSLPLSSGRFFLNHIQYPAYDEFLDRLVPEVEANVKRLRHHPSVVIWGEHSHRCSMIEFQLIGFPAGNNEGTRLKELDKDEKQIIRPHRLCLGRVVQFGTGLLR